MFVSRITNAGPSATASLRGPQQQSHKGWQPGETGKRCGDGVIVAAQAFRVSGAGHLGRGAKCGFESHYRKWTRL